MRRTNGIGSEFGIEQVITRRRRQRTGGPVTTAGLAVAMGFGLLLGFGPRPAIAMQLPSTTSADAVAAAGPPSVFMDCQTAIACDLDHFRTEIRFVNWVQGREDADVHVIAIGETTSGGGRRFTFDFLGRGDMAELSDRLTYTSSGTDVEVETRDALTQLLRMGLLRYTLLSGIWQDFDIQYAGVATDGGGGKTGDVRPDVSMPMPRNDPWNYWTFLVGVSGNFNLRETSTDLRFDPHLGADRVTEVWKLSFSAGMGLQRNERQLSDESVVQDNRNEWNGRGLVVRSVSEHLSMGIDFGAQNSIRQNQNARFHFSPAIEYNYYPYAQATRRQLTVRYGLGLEYSNYAEETIFNATEETLPEHTLDVRYVSRETWGSAGVGFNYSQYLHQSGLYELGLNVDLNFRITRGLDLTVFGTAAWQQNEIHTPLNSISDEDILLGRRSLPSNYVYFGRVGISYRFGSPFTNIVNTRFGGSGQGDVGPIGDVMIGG